MRLSVTTFMLVVTSLAIGLTKRMLPFSAGTTCQLSVSPSEIVSNFSSSSKMIIVEMP